MGQNDNYPIRIHIQKKVGEFLIERQLSIIKIEVHYIPCGGNGSGKTTLLRCMTGEIRPRSRADYCAGVRFLMVKKRMNVRFQKDK